MEQRQGEGVIKEIYFLPEILIVIVLSVNCKHAHFYLQLADS